MLEPLRAQLNRWINGDARSWIHGDADNKLVLNGLTRVSLNCFVSTFFDFSAERLERLLISAERSDSTSLDQNLLSVDACVTIPAKSRLGKESTSSTLRFPPWM